MLDDTFNLLNVYLNWEHLRLRSPTITAHLVAQTEGENKSSILREASIVLMITSISRRMYAYGVQIIMSLSNSIFPNQSTQLWVFNWQHLYDKDFAVVHVWRRQGSHKNRAAECNYFFGGLAIYLGAFDLWKLGRLETSEKAVLQIKDEYQDFPVSCNWTSKEDGLETWKNACINKNFHSVCNCHGEPLVLKAHSSTTFASLAWQVNLLVTVGRTRPTLLIHTIYAIDCYGYIPLDVTLLKPCTVLATGKTQQPQWVTRRIPKPFMDIIQAGMSN